MEALANQHANALPPMMICTSNVFQLVHIAYRWYIGNLAGVPTLGFLLPLTSSHNTSHKMALMVRFTLEQKGASKNIYMQ